MTGTPRVPPALRRHRATAAGAVALTLSGPGLAAGRPTTMARPPPSVRAPAAIVVERDLGTTILARRADQELPVASTTKLMTAYVALHRARPERLLTVQPYSGVDGETLAGLRPGELLSVRDLLAAMLLPSGGDAAHTLAVDLAGSTDGFVAAMNAAAAKLHLGATHFSTPVGLDTPGNHSSVRDLARLADALLANPVFAAIVDRRRVRLSDGRIVVNRNDLVGRYPFVVGLKTGHTDAAGDCLVAAARRDGVTVISVVLGDPSPEVRDADTLALLRYGLSRYHRVTVVHRSRVYASVPVDGRPGEQLALVARHAVRLVLGRGAVAQLVPTHLAELARGPLPKSTRLGELVVKLDGRVLARVSLVSRSPLTAPQ